MKRPTCNALLDYTRKLVLRCALVPKHESACMPRNWVERTAADEKDIRKVEQVYKARRAS